MTLNALIMTIFVNGKGIIYKVQIQNEAVGVRLRAKAFRNPFVLLRAIGE